jgi:group I intron endonuclease
LIVYLLYNSILQKAYVGQTSRRLSDRYDRNFYGAKNKYLRRAVEQHGPDSFTRIILAESKSQRQIDQLEKLWILVLGTRDRRFGFNLQAGGKYGSHIHDKSAKRKIADSRIKYWTPTRKKRMSSIMRRVWASRSAEERNAISQKHRQNHLGTKLTSMAKLRISLYRIDTKKVRKGRS